jgi:hypothetical protein
MTDHCPTCRTFAEENNALHQEVAGLNAEILKHTREKIALRGMLTKQRRQEEISRHLMAVARMWRALCSPRASIAPTGKNVEHIRTAFVNYCKGDMRARRHLLYDCIKGAALRPYDEGFGQRTANPMGSKGQGATKRVTTAHIFASEERIESLAGYYRMVQAAPLEWLDKAWQAAGAVETHWQFMYFELERRCRETGTFPATWRGRPLDPVTGLYADEPTPDQPTHLFLDDAPQETPVVSDEPRRLFVIEGGKEAA